MAVRGSPSQSGCGASAPNQRSSHWLIRPASVCRIKPHTADTTTIDVTTGEKNTVRNTTRPLNGRFTHSAMPKASAVCSGTTSSANKKVLAMARRNCGSRAPISQRRSPSDRSVRNW